MINETLKEEIKELEFDFEREIKALDGIIYNNPSAIFFDVVLIKYLDNNDTKKLALCKWNATKSLRDLMRMLFREKVFIKNLRDKENVYFAVTSKTKLLNFIWLDDIKLENISEKQLPYLTLIETSSGNYQAWIKLDKLYNENEIQTMKHYLIKTLGADKAAAAKIQPMRLPGFYSYKRIEPFYVKVYRTADKVLDGKALLYKIYNVYNKGGGTAKADAAGGSGGSDNWKKNSYYKKELELSDTTFDPNDERDMIIKWAEKQEYDIDKNIIDIMFIYQLLIRDYSESDIFLHLQNSRDDLHDKHKAGDYFERTYLKALLFKKLFFPMKKLYENRLLNEYIDEQKQLGNWDYTKKVTDNLKILIDSI